ncbi:MAG: glycosyltransferase, partial [Elusimicrobiota bacterium]|nr:glycosyltransferase [Elusimicrobiota bacterium]
RSEKLKTLNLPKESKIILSIANLKPQKNPLDMVKAAKIVAAKIPNAVFLYLGTGELKEKTENLIKRYRLANNFKLLGHRDDASELLAISDCFALTSLWEGLPMALVEALSMQTPAVCYDAGGIGEILQSGQNGFLIQRGNYHDLAAAILLVLESKLNFKQDAATLKEFDIRTMLKKQEALYREDLK